MPLSSFRSKVTASAVLVTAVLTAWRVWQGNRRRKAAGSLLVLSSETNSKVLDLRDEASFNRAHIRGSHNIPAALLWDENRWYELPEQHEPLIVLLPENRATDEDGPKPGSNSMSLADEIKSRRAEGCTATLVFDRALLKTAREEGLLVEAGKAGASAEGNGSARDVRAAVPPSPATTLFTPSPFLTRAAAVIEPHLRHAWLPLTCIDIGCGAGRDAVWLAKRGWTVVAMDCWKQALRKAVQLARRNGVSDRVDVVRGKVKHTGEIHLSTKPEQVNGGTEKAMVGAREDSSGEGSGAVTSFLGHGGSAADIVAEEEQVVRPSTPATEHGAYALVVAIRFLERSAFDTLARLVDPRGGYILLSTFIEEETEITPPGATQSGEGRGCLRGSAGGDFGGSAGKEERSLGDVFTSPVAGAAAGRSKGRGGNKASVPRADREGGQQGERVGMSTDADTGAATGDTTSTVGTPITTAMPLASSSSSLWSEEEWGIASPGEQSGNLLAEHRRPDVDSSNSSVNRENSEARTENTYPTGKIQKRKPGSKPAARKRKPGSAAAALEAAAAAATMARWPHASPRDPKKILRRGELARYFGGRHGFEVLEDSVERLPDGRPVACFLARKMPLVVSSPSNASSNSSSPWRDDPTPRKSPIQPPPEEELQQNVQPPRSLQQQQQQGGRPASSFGAVPTTGFFLGKLAPTPEDSALKSDNDADDDDGGRTRQASSPAISFPAHPSTSLDHIAGSGGGGGSHGEEKPGGDAEDGGGGGGGVVDEVRSGRAGMWSGFSGVGSGSRRDFTASRAASSIRRLAAQRESGGSSVDAGGGGGGSW